MSSQHQGLIESETLYQVDGDSTDSNNTYYEDDFSSSDDSTDDGTCSCA